MLSDVSGHLEYGIGASAINFNGKHRYIRITDISNWGKNEITSPSFIEKSAILNDGDILLARTGATVGDSFIYKDDGVESYFAGFLIRTKVQKANPYFVYYQLKTQKYAQWVKISSARSGQPGINSEQFGSYRICITEYNEQQKIANFLKAIDERIEAQNKIIDNLYSQKKYLKSIIFNNDIPNHKIGDFLEEYIEKNVNNYEPVSVGKYGIRKRSEIFSRELSEDYSKNKVIHKDSLTIGMGTKEIDIAILLDDYHYCVSPAYTTYKIKNIDSYYFNELLDSLNYLLSLRYMISGARQGKSVNKKELMNHQIFVHTVEQQSVIKSLLISIDNKIDNETKLLKKNSQQKNYLLDNLFI